MELKYSQAIKAGVIGGIVIIMLILLMLAVSVVSMSMGSAVTMANCCVWLVVLIAMVAIGAIATHFARAGLRDLNDSLITGAVSGAIASILGTIFMVLEYVAVAYLFPAAYSSINPVLTSYTPGVAGLLLSCCCGPFLIMASAVTGAIGGAIYYLAKQQS